MPTNWSPITDSDSDICEESDPELREHLLFEQRENKHAYELLRTIHVEEQRRQLEEEALSAYIRANPWNPYLPVLPSSTSIIIIRLNAACLISTLVGTPSVLT